MAKIDEIYTRSPFFGSRRIMIELRKYNLSVGRRKVQTLMDKMGIEPFIPDIISANLILSTEYILIYSKI
jgi:hypothetical protein